MMARAFISGFLGAGVLLAFAASAEPSQALKRLDPSVKAFLIARFTSDFDAQSEAEAPTRAVSAELQRSDGRKDILVYITGRYWCGSGGCQMLILEPTGGSFRVIAETSIVWAPIRRLSTSTHGHPDIGVRVQGGGIQPGYEARLRFAGSHYPRNPSLVSAVPNKGSAGVILISNEDKGELLFQ